MPAVAQKTLQKTSQSRVFTIDGGASPNTSPVYQSLARAQAASWPQGDVTPVRVPDPDAYESFVVVDQIKGVKTGNKGGHGDVPKEDVVIEKAIAL